MKRTKRIFSVLLVMTLLLTATFNNGVIVNAATDISSAKSISVNSTYTGNIESGYNDEKDYYKFTVSQSGYVTINFTNSSPSSSTSDAWNITLLTNYAAETITSSVAKLNNSSISLTTIGLSAGTYYICVESKSSYSAISTNNYSINANFTSANNWEKEFNSNTESANVINTNTTYYGTTHNGYDYEKDYYKFTTSSNGYVTIDFTNSNPVSTSNEAWTVTLYGFNSDGLTEVISQVVSTSNSKISMTTVGLPAGTYYVRVQSKGSYYAVSNSKYAICANFTADYNWEQEFNEDVSTSNAIETNHIYYGTTRNGYDCEKDYYKFETTSDGYVTVDFTNSSPTSSSNEAWTITLYGFSSNALTEITSLVANTNNSKVSLVTVGLPKGIYYVCVKSKASYYAVSTNKYALKVNYTSSNNWEKEFNEDNTTATSITTQAKYSGTIRNGYDCEKDYYKFKTTGQGAIDVTFFNDTSSTSTSEAWTMNVYDSSLTLLDSKTIKLNDTSVTTQLTGKAAGTYYICIQSKVSYCAVSTNSYQLKVVGTGIPSSNDTTKPTGSISSTNNIASSQTVTLTLSDNVGVAGYYWGTSSSYGSNTYTSTSSIRIDKTISTSGTYYLTVKDTSGNLSNTYSVTFYKTTLNANGGSVSPSSIITASGNSFTFPTPTKSGYTYNGWSTSSSATSGLKTLTPTSNTTYYAVWTPTPTPTITLSATSKSMTVGSTATLTATTTPSGQTVTWTSSNTSVATVSNGTITAKSAGTATITAKFTYNGSTYSKTCSVTVTPAATARIEVESKTARSGNEVKLAVSLGDNPGLAYLKLKVSYDSSALELVSAQNAGLLSGTFTTSKTTDINPYVIQWMGADDSDGNGTIVNLTFCVKDNAAEGNYTITLTAEEAYNSAYEDVTFTVTNGTVTVRNVIIGDVNGDEIVNGKDGILLAQYLAGWNVTIVDLAADCNGDGNINGKDGILLAQYLAGWDVTLG